MEHDQKENSFAVALISFALSAAINGAVLFSFDRMYSPEHSSWIKERRETARKKKEPLQFEFVEAPPVKVPAKSKNKKKIAAFDALNSGAVRNKNGEEGSPHMKVRGPADQLAQKRGKAASEPAPEIKPVAPVSAVNKPEKKAGRQIKENKDEIILPKETPAQSAMKPRSKSEWLSGQDKITTQAMSKTLSPGTKSFGITSFEAAGSGMGEYMKHLKEKVWLAWFPYLAFQYPSDFRGADVVVSFTLDSRGEVKIVKVLESHGSKVFASYCMEAIQKASSFGVVPKEILALTGKDELEIKFGFHYG